jgi:hypothetical protein
MDFNNSMMGVNDLQDFEGQLFNLQNMANNGLDYFNSNQ